MIQGTDKQTRSLTEDKKKSLHSFKSCFFNWLKKKFLVFYYSVFINPVIRWKHRYGGRQETCAKLYVVPKRTSNFQIIIVNSPFISDKKTYHSKYFFFYQS